MSNQGDFLKGQKEQELFRQKHFRSVQFISLGVLIIYCILVGLTFSSLIYFQKQEQGINEQLESKKAAIADFKKIESLDLLLKQRLSFLSKNFLEKRPPWLKLFTFFDSNLVGGITFKEIKITETGKTVISGAAGDALSLGRFLENITPNNQNLLFSKVTLSSVTRQKDGSYLFNLDLEANGEAKSL